MRFWEFFRKDWCVAMGSSVSEPASGFETWRTISLDSRFKELEVIEDPAKSFEQILVKADYKVSPWAKGLMGRSDFAKSLAKADPDQSYGLVRLTTAQLTDKESEMSTTNGFLTGFMG